MKVQIGIIGGEEKNLDNNIKEFLLKIAEEVGEEVAKKGAILITGGCTGIAEAASKGALKLGGITLGTPGRKRGTSVKSTMIEICTPIEIGDYVFAGIPSCDSIIIFPGGPGTLGELAFAIRNKKPLIAIKGISETLINNVFKNCNIDYPFYLANNAQEAAEIAYKIGKDVLKNEIRIKESKQRRF